MSKSDDDKPTQEEKALARNLLTPTPKELLNEEFEDPINHADKNLSSIIPDYKTLPERTRAYLEGAALVANGHSYRSAAKLTNTDFGALWRYCKRHGVVKGATADQRMEFIQERSMMIFEEASSQQMDALVAGEVSANQMPVVMGIAADKAMGVEKVRNANKGGEDLFSKVLEKLSEDGGELKLSVKSKADQAIDVTPAK